MTWTYEDKNLGQGGQDDLRAIIGDNVVTDPQLSDEEIRFFITQRSSLLGAAAVACLALATKYSRSVDQAAGTFKTQFSQMAKAYYQKAIHFEIIAAQGGSGMPYAGGISVTDKNNQQLDTDRVNPQFAIGMHDSFSPVPPEDTSENIGSGAIGGED